MALTARRTRFWRRGVVAALLFIPASTGLGDSLGFGDELPAALPTQRSAPLALTIAEDAATPVHRIVIPKAVLATLAGDLPDASTIASASPTRSIVAALAVSAAVACGLVASRRGRPGRLAAGVIVGLMAAGLLPGIGASADQAPANAPPRPIVGRPIAPPAEAGGADAVVVAHGSKMLLEIAPDDAEAIVLVVGKAAAK